MLWLIPINFTGNIPLQIPENVDAKARILSVCLLRAPQNPITSENELNIVKLIPTVPPCVQIHFLVLSPPQPFTCANEAFQPWKLIHPKTSLTSPWTLEKLLLTRFIIKFLPGVPETSVQNPNSSRAGIFLKPQQYLAVKTFHYKLGNRKNPWRMNELAAFWKFQGKVFAKNIQANYINLTTTGHKDLYTSIGADLISLHTEEFC